MKTLAVVALIAMQLYNAIPSDEEVAREEVLNCIYHQVDCPTDIEDDNDY